MKAQSYGGFGRKPADPTPAELRQRIREVRAMRNQRDAKRSRLQAKHSAAIFAILIGSGSATSMMVARNVGIDQRVATDALSSMAAQGLVEPIGNSNSRCYQLASADSILASFRTKAEQRSAARADIVGAKRSRNRSLQVA
jgi:predicted transcriptional regulator